MREESAEQTNKTDQKSDIIINSVHDAGNKKIKHIMSKHDF